MSTARERAEETLKTLRCDFDEYGCRFDTPEGGFISTKDALSILEEHYKAFDKLAECLNQSIL